MKNIFLIFWLFICCGEYQIICASDSDSLRWTPEFSFSLKRITDVVISPDGRFVAYVVREAVTDKEKSEFVSQIYVAATDGNFDRQFTFGNVSCSHPRFSPTADRLAFLSSRNGSSQIFIMWMNGGEACQVTSAPADISSFKWAPDGMRIAYLMRDPQTDQEKTGIKEKTDIRILDTNYKYTHLYVVPAGISGNQPSAVQISSGKFTVDAFDWSPDGRTIVFSYLPDPALNTRFVRADIALVPSDSGSIQKLVDRPGVDENPIFSPDGRYIAFTSSGGRPEPVGLSDLYVVPARGGRPERLSLTPDRNATLVGWSPDGKSVYASEELGTSGHLLAVKVKGAEQAVVTLGNLPLTGDEGPGTPGGSNGTYSNFSLAGKLWMVSFTYQEAGQPEEVYISRLFPWQPEKLSHLNDSVMFPEISKTELISWNSPDGKRIEGLLTYPAGYKPGRKYPLILIIHGGPKGVFTNYFTGIPTLYQVQFMSAKGYAVLRPNPRGSSGYGMDFRYANVRDWGYGDYEDVISGVDKIIDSGIADPARLFVTGWSYGGYMTSFIITRTGRFRAASMGAGLSDLVSMVYTTDIPDYLVAHMGHELWEDYDIYEKHSALFQVENINTPLQVLHGENDLRVPTLQGKEIYMALKRRGVPVEMVIYPRTEHSPSEPKLLMDVTPRILDWFKRF